MVFALGNLYSLKCWSLLAALRTRAIRWAHATCALSVEAETPLRSLEANIVCDGCPTFVPSLPGHFFLSLESEQPRLSVVCRATTMLDQMTIVCRAFCVVVRDSAAPLRRQAPNRKG
jgi:hypothetical protein